LPREGGPIPARAAAPLPGREVIMNAARVVSIAEAAHLRNIQWLSQLGDETLAEFERAGSSRRYARGETIFAPAATPGSVYLLHSGLARIYRLSEGGGETSFGYVAPGAVFGELTAFGDFPRESFAQAVRPSL